VSLIKGAVSALQVDRTSFRTEVQRPILHNVNSIYARVALGAAFLSAVASRFGLWEGHVSLERFGSFMRYTADVNSFMPGWTIPFLAWAATGAELGLGIALLTGIWLRPTALASALLLALFGTAMAISFGIKSPLDYSVFSASAAGLLLADCQRIERVDDER
jgi:putative oxidoreductase